MAIFNEFGDLDDLGPPKQQYPDRQLVRLNTSNFKLETPPANCQPGTDGKPEAAGRSPGVDWAKMKFGGRSGQAGGLWHWRGVGFGESLSPARGLWYNRGVRGREAQGESEV